MDSGQNSQKYDYLIYDSKGVRKVIDGKEYPAIEKDLPKKHRDSGCTECTFVQDQKTLFTFFVPRDLKEKAGRKPVFVGKFTMPDWSGHSGFYLFKCSNCDDVCIDYPHGYRGNGYLYVRCDKCQFEIILAPGKYKDIYQQEQVVSPPTVWQELGGLWKNRLTREERKRLKTLHSAIAKIEDEQGVKTFINGPYIVSDPKAFNFNTKKIETVDPSSFTHGIISTIRNPDLMYKVIFWLLIVYAFIYGFKVF